MKTLTLHCKRGNHDWQRPSQRGRRPFDCPNCTITQTASPQTAVATPQPTTRPAGEAGKATDNRWTTIQSPSDATIARMKSDLERWNSEYVDLEATCLTADLSVFDQLDRLQRAIINGNNRLRELERTAAAS